MNEKEKHTPKQTEKPQTEQKQGGTPQNEQKKQHQGLYVKPIRKRGGTSIGTRELTTSNTKESTLSIPKPKMGEIRILIFGGVTEIGKNMYGIEYNDEILILDCGMAFADARTPGIDFVVPNTQYVEERKDKIKGILVSHGHLDHIGGLSVIAPKLGNPPIYTRSLTAELIRRRHKEYTNTPPLIFREIEKETEVEISENFKISFFAVTHTIPDAMGTIIETPSGCIVFTGDLKLSHTNGKVDQSEVESFKVFKNKKILCTIADSTNSERSGWSIPEARVVENLGNIIKETPGRIILSSFSSQIDRNIRIIEYAHQHGRKVVVEGRSMNENLNIAYKLGLLKVPLNTIVPTEKMHDYPNEKILALVTGAQGDEFAALNRISQGTHRHIKLEETDTVIFSSSIIPGNEEPVQNLKDRISRFGSSIVTYQTSDVHSSGHSNREELRWIHEQIKTKFLIPVHGYHYMLRAHANILQELGLPPENIILSQNGYIIDISADGETIQKTGHMPTAITVVDGNAIGEVQPVVLQDRKTLGETGIFVVIVMINQRTKSLKKHPDIISRGFIYLRDSQQLINKVRYATRKVVETSMQKTGAVNVEKIKRNLAKETQQILYRETKKNPIIIPVVLVS